MKFRASSPAKSGSIFAELFWRETHFSPNLSSRTSLVARRRLHLPPRISTVSISTTHHLARHHHNRRHTSHHHHLTMTASSIRILTAAIALAAGCGRCSAFTSNGLGGINSQRRARLPPPSSSSSSIATDCRSSLSVGRKEGGWCLMPTLMYFLPAAAAAYGSAPSPINRSWFMVPDERSWSGLSTICEAREQGVIVSLFLKLPLHILT